jgi:hypothetical protein
VSADLPGNAEPIKAAQIAADAAVQVAHITAEATIKAAQIAADAAHYAAFVSAGGAIAALLGAVIAAYVAYKNVSDAYRRAQAEKEKEKSVLAAQVRTTVLATIGAVDQALVAYKGDFREPVEVRVLPMPTSLETREPTAFASLGPAVNEAVELVRLRLNDYRRAKAPIQDRMRRPGDDKPVILDTRPDDFDTVINTAETYKATLGRLERLLLGEAAHKS